MRSGLLPVQGAALISLGLLRLVLLALVLGPLATLVTLSLTAEYATVNSIGPVVMLSVGLGGGWLLHRGRVQAAIRVMVWGVLLGISGIAALTGGLRSPVIVVFPVLILMYGWLDRASHTLLLTAAVGLVSLGLWAGEAGAWLPAQTPAPLAIYVLHQLIVYILASVLIVFVLKAYTQRLQELARSGEQLAEQTRLLQQNTDVLNRAQAVAAVGSWVSDIEADLITPSPHACQIFGIAPGSTLRYAGYMAQVHADDRADTVQAWRAALQGASFDVEHRVLAAGQVRWIRQRAEIEFGPHGRAVSALGIVQDITERKLIQLALKQSEQRYRTLIEWTPEAILVHRNTRILYANPAAVRLFAAPDAASLLRHTTTELIDPSYLDSQLARMQRIHHGEQVLPLAESRFVRLDGQSIDVEVQGTAIEFDGESAIHVSVRDITERKRMETEIRQLAFYDSLTDLPNRRLLSERIKQAISINRRSGRYGALMFLDLDNFKPLNDTHGHSVGDLLLAQAAQRLKHCVRGMDTVARFGGDEFVVLLSELDPDAASSHQHALAVAEKIKRSLAEPYTLQIQQPNGRSSSVQHCCTTSIGAVLFASDLAAPDELIKWADAAMYQAKGEGRDCISFSRQVLAQAGQEALRADWPARPV